MLNDPADYFDKKRFNVADHIKRIFGMYGGDLVHATLSFDNSLVNVVLDYFGKDIALKAKDDGWIEVKADVSVSPVFLAWMFQFGDHAQIKAPESLIIAMRELLQANAQKYLPLSE
jgi:predicted DNA-binding transcriptional regulator YafY